MKLLQNVFRQGRQSSSCDSAQQRWPRRCSLLHPREQLVCKSAASLWSHFGVVTLWFDFLLFKEVCYCHQGLYLITGRHQREMKHSCDSLECAFWRKPVPSLWQGGTLEDLFPSWVNFYFFAWAKEKKNKQRKKKMFACHCLFLISLVLYLCLQERIQIAWKLTWKVHNGNKRDAHWWKI